MLERFGYRRTLTLDQVFSSVTNFILSFGLLRVTDPETFGYLAALLLIVGFSTEIARASIGEALLLYCEGRPLSLRAAVTGGFPLLAGALVAMLLMGSITGLAGLVVVIFALSVVGVLLQEILRYSAIAVRRPDIALRMSFGWFVIQVPVAIFAMTTQEPALGLVAAWGMGGAAALVIAVLSWKRLVGDPNRDFFVRNRSNLVRFGLELLIDRGAAYLVVAIVGVVVGFIGVGEIQSARLLFALANPALFVLPAMLIPIFEAATSRSRRILVGSVVAAAVVSMAIAGLAWLNPAGLTELIVQENWEGARPLIPWVGLSFGLGVVRLIYRTYLRAISKVEVVTKLRVMDSIAVAATSICAALWFGVIGAVVGRAGALGVGSLVWSREVVGNATDSGPNRTPPSD